MVRVDRQIRNGNLVTMLDDDLTDLSRDAVFAYDCISNLQIMLVHPATMNRLPLIFVLLQMVGLGPLG